MRDALRYAVVTGGGGGLGRAFCQQLAREGWSVAIVDIDDAAAAQTLESIEQEGGIGRIEHCDVTAREAWHSLRARLAAAWPRLDLLVNNAGMFGAGFIGDVDLDAAERLIQLNLMSVVYGCSTMVPWLLESASSSTSRAGATGSSSAGRNEPPLEPPHRPYLINVASVFAHFCPPGMGVYSASKAGVVALSETLDGELRPRGIGVTVVCPGVMPTQFADRATFDDERYRRLTQKYIAESTLTPDIVAAAALRGMRSGELYVIVGTRERWYWRAKRLLPTTFLRRVARRVRRDLKRPTTG
jgi:NAD(P)-dependent dehydrogenase (short-subunit alcohol dehydrogenase family)